jgi:hypothetical protein
MGKMGSPVAFVLDPVETKERKKERRLSEFATQTLLLPHSNCNTK